MKRLLAIDSCSECKYLGDTSYSVYGNCILTKNNRIDSVDDMYIIPDDCPLEIAEPKGPPNREVKISWFAGDVETEESKQRTAVWKILNM